MNSYTTKKLGEEGSEVAQAAFKVLLHQDRPARDDFVGELADLQAMIALAIPHMSKREQAIFNHGVRSRIERERKKGKIG